MKTHLKRTVALNNNETTRFSIIQGQCTDAMRVEIKPHENYNTIATDLDVVELLKIIKGVAFNSKTQKYTYKSIHEAMCKYWVTHQGMSKTVHEYHDKFMN
jgi:hypothetical protein